MADSAPTPQPKTGTVRVPIVAVQDGARVARSDVLATEEPLEVRVAVAGQIHSIAVTMRTPGHDFELAAGFLFSEGIIAGRAAVQQVRYCAEPQNYNIVTVELRPGTPFDPQRFTRHVYTSSSCGVCGKATLDQVRAQVPAPLAATAVPDTELILALPERLRQEQGIFAKTGGLHASALFDRAGQLVVVREDVGRHNALDKVIGGLLLKDGLPAREHILLVSGRASFELVQKALMAGIPVLAAVGAPSSLAVELAREFGLTLIGFLRERRFNVYSGANGSG